MRESEIFARYMFGSPIGYTTYQPTTKKLFLASTLTDQTSIFTLRHYAQVFLDKFRFGPRNVELHAIITYSS